MNDNIFEKLEFGPFKPLLDNEDITEISYTNGGQVWVHSLSKGNVRVEVEGITPELVEKLAYECSSIMGTTFNNAKPFLDASTSELHLSFVHPSIATNGIALVIRKTPAKIRIEQDKMVAEGYFTKEIHDFLMKCVEAHCNIIVAGEPDAGKTEFVKYLAGHTRPAEKIITIEQKSELNLDKIFPQRNIITMRANNIANYLNVLDTAMRQNPKWIVLSEIRNPEVVEAVKTTIAAGYNLISTINSDRASNIPSRLYGFMENMFDIKQFLPTIHRYIQIGVHIKTYHSRETGKLRRELDEVVEFYVDDDNEPHMQPIYKKALGKNATMYKPSEYLMEYLENQNVDISSTIEKAVEYIPPVPKVKKPKKEVEEVFAIKEEPEEKKEEEKEEKKEEKVLELQPEPTQTPVQVAQPVVPQDVFQPQPVDTTSQVAPAAVAQPQQPPFQDPNAMVQQQAYPQQPAVPAGFQQPQQPFQNANAMAQQQAYPQQPAVPAGFQQPQQSLPGGQQMPFVQPVTPMA